MSTATLDHVNVIATDLDASAGFYGELLGLERRDGPAPLTPSQAQWMHDSAGRPVVHINSVDCPRAYDREVRPGPTGALHHIAFRCEDYDAMVGRLTARKLDHRVNLVASIGLRQIFVSDPDGVLLELNFFGG